MDWEVLRPMTAEEVAAFMEVSLASYAQDLVAAGQATPEEAPVQARASFSALMEAEGLEQALRAVLDDTGARVGFLWYTLMPESRVLYVSDIVIDAAHRGRGHGRRAMLALEPVARARGYALGLHVHTHNAPAYALYCSLGYAVLRSEEGSTYMIKQLEEG